MIPPPPRPTLFPYTTLFRSLQSADELKRRLRITGWFALAFVVIAILGTADRKSTRLNSSHVAISYAVFCLKKKRQGPGSRKRLWTATSKTYLPAPSLVTISR